MRSPPEVLETFSASATKAWPEHARCAANAVHCSTAFLQMHVMVSSNCIDASVGSVEICISFSATKDKNRLKTNVLRRFS